MDLTTGLILATFLTSFLLNVFLLFCICFEHLKRRRVEGRLYNLQNSPVHLGWWTPCSSTTTQTPLNKGVQTKSKAQASMSNFSITLHLQNFCWRMKKETCEHVPMTHYYYFLFSEFGCQSQSQRNDKHIQNALSPCDEMSTNRKRWKKATRDIKTNSTDGYGYGQPNHKSTPEMNCSTPPNSISNRNVWARNVTSRDGLIIRLGEYHIYISFFDL